MADRTEIVTRAVIFDMYETLISLATAPPYFSADMAADADIPLDKFSKQWHGTEHDRTVGKMTLEQAIELILRENGRCSDELFTKMVRKRSERHDRIFKSMDSGIIPMLDELKERGMLIGLISNCFSEESAAIKRSVLYPYFDTVCLSYDEGICKPDIAIFRLCAERLGVSAEECLYIGDGGSDELEAADNAGMRTAQAVWYIDRTNDHNANRPCRKPGFVHIERPADVLDLI